MSKRAKAHLCRTLSLARRKQHWEIHEPMTTKFSLAPNSRTLNSSKALKKGPNSRTMGQSGIRQMGSQNSTSNSSESSARSFGSTQIDQNSPSKAKRFLAQKKISLLLIRNKDQSCKMLITGFLQYQSHERLKKSSLF